jgi:hypothetical protein
MLSAFARIRVHFPPGSALIEDLSVASRNGKLRQALATYLQPYTLVIDEVGYLTYDDDAANVLFHVVNDRHLRRVSRRDDPDRPQGQVDLEEPVIGGESGRVWTRLVSAKARRSTG